MVKKREIENIGFKTLAVSALLIFLLMLCLIKFDIAIPIDKWVNLSIGSIYTPFLNSLMFFIVNITSTTNSIAIGIIFIALLFLIKRKREAIILFLAVLSAFFLEFLTKILVHRPRPENALLSLTDYGFPSGHSTLSALIFALLIYAFKDNIKNKALRYSFVSVCVLLALLIGFSRLYIRVHWLSDVFGGFVLGIFCFALFASYLHKPKSKN